MRIGLFTDTYRPSTNGIVTVVDITRRHLEALGHEVFIFCPAGQFRRNKTDNDAQIIQIRAIKGVFFDDYRTSLFFPPSLLKKVRKLNLDVIHFFTPGQIGLMAVYAGRKTGAITVAQHSTDVYQYIAHYPMAVPGVFLLSTMVPLSVKLNSEQRKRLLRQFLPSRAIKWGRKMIEATVTILYSGCDATILLSKKSEKQIRSWKGGNDLNLQLIPSGVDPIANSGVLARQSFRRHWGIPSDAEVVTYVGRLGSEKNLDLLISMFKKVSLEREKAWLLFVGDFEYGDELKELARDSGLIDQIVFTGMLPRTALGDVYAASDIFAFPSLTDTQGLVLHEAAQAGLPIVLIDPDLSQVVQDGVNGFVVDNDATAFADGIVKILADPDLKSEFSRKSVELATGFSERNQTKELVKLYSQLTTAKTNAQDYLR